MAAVKVRNVPTHRVKANRRLAIQVLGIFLLTYVPLATVLVAAVTDRFLSDRDAARVLVVAKGRDVGSRLTEMIDGGRRVLVALAGSPSLHSDNVSQITALFARYSALLPFDNRISLLGTDGKIKIITSPGQQTLDVSDRDWFKDTVRQKTFTVGQFVYSRLTSQPTIPLSLPLLDAQGNVNEVLVLSLDLEWINRYVSQMGLAKNSDLQIISPDATVLLRYPTAGSSIGRQFPSHPLVKAALSRTVEFVETQGLDGNSRIFAFYPINFNQAFYGILAVGIPTAEVYAKTLDFLLWSVFFLILFLILSLFLKIKGLNQTILAPIKALNQATLLIAGGDYSKRLLPMGNTAEIVDLAASFNAMAHALEDQRNELTNHRKHLEQLVDERTQELNRSVAALERSNRELQQFAYAASHDLQEPLRMVASFTQLLAERYGALLDDRGRTFIEFAVDGARRMQALINDLLDFTRVESQPKEASDIDAERCFQMAVTDLGPAITEKGAVVLAGPLPQVHADSSQLVRIFENLISNGLKFNTGPAPRVEVSARSSPEGWVFCVQDNGIGIDSQYQARVFEIFQRLNPRDTFPGTGIGLAICQRIVERQGGRIWFESPGEGLGTRFLFTMPAVHSKGAPE